MSITNTEGYFVKYTSLVKETNFQDAFANQTEIINSFCNKINEEKSLYAYAAGKWTLREMLQHIIDTERIFSYRALAIARGETTTLPGFDENEYAAKSNGNARTWLSLVAEMNVVRSSTKLMFESFTEDMLATKGKFTSNTADPKNLGLIMLGHVYHHISIAEERYLS